MYLSASAPSIESMQIWLKFMNEWDDIIDKNYFENYHPDALQASARASNLPIEEYISIENEKKQKNAIQELKREYGFLDEGNDKKPLKNIINSFIDQLDGDDTAKESLDKLFLKPDSIKGNAIGKI